MPPSGYLFPQLNLQGLYFPPFVISRRLKPLDIVVMKALHNKVNIVPVIAKADTLTKKEVKTLKERVSQIVLLRLIF